MSNQDRLLSDEELRKSIEEIIITDDYSYGIQMRTIDKMEKLIDTQKRLYAESVIGEKGTRLSKLGNTLCDELIDEQRARIK